MDLQGLEPRTDRLWAGCSNQLSYRSISLKPMNGLEPLTCWLQISCSANWATSAYYTAQLICNQPALPTIASLHSTIVINWATSAYTISAHIIVQMIFIRNQSVPFNTYYIVSLTTRQLKYNTSDSDGNRTRVTAVKGRCLNRLTTEPYSLPFPDMEKLPE